jgi:uncharacterized protein with GYD domain
MATYIVLGNLTDQGIRSVKETTKRAEAFKQMAQKAGVKVKEVYWTLGQYDLATIVEAPDEETVTALGLSACSLGNIRGFRRPRCPTYSGAADLCFHGRFGQGPGVRRGQERIHESAYPLRDRNGPKTDASI